VAFASDSSCSTDALNPLRLRQRVQLITESSTKIFITGAAGYIGGSIAEKLVASGHEVKGLARSREQAQLLKTRGMDSLQSASAASAAGDDQRVHAHPLVALSLRYLLPGQCTRSRSRWHSLFVKPLQARGVVLAASERPCGRLRMQSWEASNDNSVEVGTPGPPPSPARRISVGGTLPLDRPKPGNGR